MKNIVLTMLLAMLSVVVNPALAQTNVNGISKNGTSKHVFELINQRLSYMPDVALYKAQKHLAVENVERETIVINKAMEVANSKGVNPDTIKKFFIAQISAAKAIEYRYFADFLSDDSFNSKPTKDLNKEVRPALITLGNEIVFAMAEKLHATGNFSEAERQEFYQSITVDKLTNNDKKQLFNALLLVRAK